MFSLSDSQQYYLCSHPIDVRKGFDSLCSVVSSFMKRDPLSGEVFVFINKSRTRIELLHWEPGGLVIYHKRLETGRLRLPVLNVTTGGYHLSWCHLVLMVEGVLRNGITRKKDIIYPQEPHK